KAPDDLRPEVIRALTDESKLEDSIDGEVRKILGSYSRPMPEGSREWEVLYQKTREEVFRKRFRLSSASSLGSPARLARSPASACSRSLAGTARRRPTSPSPRRA